MSTPADRRAPDLIPSRPLTGVCAEGRHDACSGSVYVGHTFEHGAEYDPCSCPCHDEVEGTARPAGSGTRPNGELGTPREVDGRKPDALQEAADASERVPDRAGTTWAFDAERRIVVTFTDRVYDGETVDVYRSFEDAENEHGPRRRMRVEEDGPGEWCVVPVPETRGAV